MEQDPRDNLIKEVFAQFGLAYYLSECLHRGLCVCYAAGPFKDKSHATRPYYEERLAAAFSLTLGQISLAIKEFLPDDLHAEVEKACDKRNYLAHHFWYERCNMLHTEDRIGKVINELIDLASTFERLDADVQNINQNRMAIFGIGDEQLDNILIDIMSGKVEDPLPKNRAVRKKEYIVQIWNAPTRDGATSLLFQTEDGKLLQLCADGLGWSHIKKQADNWEIDKSFQKYLPASVEIRPKKENPWNYEINFSTGILLWVKLGSREKTFKCGIKKLSV